MADAHANFAYSTIAVSATSAGLNFSVAAGDGAKFPAVPFNATVWPASVQPLTTNAEILRVTARATDAMTATRAQESTTAINLPVGTQIANTITNKVLTDVETVAAAAIPKSIGSASGDIVIYTGVSTPARLGIGATNAVLSASASGLPAWRNVGPTSVQVVSASGAGTYTPPAGITAIMIEIVGGGGAGGGVLTGGNRGAAGGGSGGYARLLLTSISGASSYTCGGGGVGALSAVGGNGGATYWSTSMTANGGTGGNAASAAGAGIGGAGGTATGGNVNITGNPGISQSQASAPGSAGGASFFGGGGSTVNTSVNGNPGTTGSGGGGACDVTSGTSRTGGAGGKGLIVVTEYQ